MEDLLIMSKKELERKSLLDGYVHGKLSLKEIASKLELSYRQVKRLWKRYQCEEDKGLIHRSRGKAPQNAYPDAFKKSIMELYSKKYLGFGPTFAAEKLLLDDKVNVCAETLRLWLKKEGLWTRVRKRKQHREKRERRPNFGDLIQIDGSIHDWFAMGSHSCLLNMVDDATGITFALLDTGETTFILLRALKAWIELYGIPKAVYVDLKSVYVGSKKLKEKYDDDLLIQEGFSVFEVACRALNIEIIRAYSAQAKGRVERKHRVFQDRFAKDLKLYGIKTLEEANAYLETTFLNQLNHKFSQAPKEGDAHRDSSSYGDLDQIICWTYKRQVRNDWTIQFNRQYYQIEKGTDVVPQNIITIRRYLNGAMKFWFNDKELPYFSLKAKPEPPSRQKKYYQVKGGADLIIRSQISRKNKHKSPFNRFNPDWLSNKNSSKAKSSLRID